MEVDVPRPACVFRFNKGDSPPDVYHILMAFLLVPVLVWELIYNEDELIWTDQNKTLHKMQNQKKRPSNLLQRLQHQATRIRFTIDVY